MSTNTIAKPAHWTVGTKVPGKKGYEVARVREFFAVLKSDTKPTKWAVEFIDGKRVEAKTSAEAGEKGRAYRDKQKAKGVTVAKAPRATKAPAKKAPATKAPAKKAPAKKAPAKK